MWSSLDAVKTRHNSLLFEFCRGDLGGIPANRELHLSNRESARDATKVFVASVVGCFLMEPILLISK